MKTKIPDTIYLFPTFLTVRDVTKDEAPRYKGVTNWNDREIGIDLLLHEEDQKLTMLHEITHCILNLSGFRKHNEMMLDTLAAGFLSIIRGNKDLIRWLEEIK